ncbi:integral membrane protein [Serinibacter arcticus]|uniref:Integral membrane protein n=2 Tax=Serinibacter arcticus TaxID=1655435 RepID=A0A4Z1DYF6_9MICO|nr:integral membrane protein [Serinibacter arcticus]
MPSPALHHRRRPPGRLATWWRTRPQLPLAIRAGIAAVLAWLIAQHLPVPLSDYPYYGPLGAVIATTTTLVSSLREAGRTVAAIAAGATLATLVDVVLDPGAAAIVIVVGAGTLIAGWHRLGDAGSWVVTSSLFILIIGRTDPDGYAIAYLGTTAVGALVGVAVAAALPPLPLTAGSRDLEGLRTTLADQLADLAEGLRRRDLPAASEWQSRRYVIEPSLHGARAALARSIQSARGNWSARFFRDWITTQRDELERLETVADTVFEVTTLVVEHEHADARSPLLGPDLRGATADALDAFAAVLHRTTPTGEEASAGTRRLSDSIAELRRAVIASHRGEGGSHLGAGAVVVALERGAAAMTGHSVPPGT